MEVQPELVGFEPEDRRRSWCLGRGGRECRYGDHQGGQCRQGSCPHTDDFKTPTRRIWFAPTRQPSPHGSRPSLRPELQPSYMKDTYIW